MGEETEGGTGVGQDRETSLEMSRRLFPMEIWNSKEINSKELSIWEREHTDVISSHENE